MYCLLASVDFRRIDATTPSEEEELLLQDFATKHVLPCYGNCPNIFRVGLEVRVLGTSISAACDVLRHFFLFAFPTSTLKNFRGGVSAPNSQTQRNTTYGRQLLAYLERVEAELRRKDINCPHLQIAILYQRFVGHYWLNKLADAELYLRKSLQVALTVGEQVNSSPSGGQDNFSSAENLPGHERNLRRHALYVVLGLFFHRHGPQRREVFEELKAAVEDRLRGITETD